MKENVWSVSALNENISNRSKNALIDKGLSKKNSALKLKRCVSKRRKKNLSGSKIWSNKNFNNLRKKRKKRESEILS